MHASQARFNRVTQPLKWGHGTPVAWRRNGVSLGMGAGSCHWVLCWERAAYGILFNIISASYPFYKLLPSLLSPLCLIATSPSL